VNHDGHSITECEDRKCELPLDLEDTGQEEEELLRRLSDEDASC
jgi:hypothetical protein